MRHICTICGRTLVCLDGDDCEQPEKMAMNCGVNLGTPFHQDEYVKGVGDQGDAAGPEMGVGLGAGNLGREVLGKLAPDGGNIDADLFEQAAAHDRHGATAARRRISVDPGPGFALETAGRHIAQATRT